MWTKRNQAGGAFLDQQIRKRAAARKRADVLVGAASILDLGGVSMGGIRLGSLESDMRTIGKDVRTIGSDMRVVMGRETSAQRKR